MNKTLPLNVIACLDKIYSRMHDNYLFAYPKNNFDVNRAHPVLCRFGVFSSMLTHLFNTDNIIPSNEIEKIFFQQILGNAKVMMTDKDWAYPNNSLSENRTSSALNSLESCMKNYHNSIKLLGNHCFSDKTANFDVINFISTVSCINSFNYAYPNNYYNEDKAHAAFQMLLSLTETVNYIVDSISTNNEELKTIISNYSNKINSAHQTLKKAYPNNSFNHSSGHQYLTQFMDIWKNAKEVCVPALKTHFEKQAIITDYETKLSQYNNFSSISKNTIIVETEVVDEPIVPLVKKIKSLL